MTQFELMAVLPELWLSLSLCALLLWGVTLTESSSYLLPKATLVILAVALVATVSQGTPSQKFFSGHFQVDNLSRFLKTLILSSSLLITLYSSRYIRYKDSEQVEYYFLSLSSVLGMCVLVSGGSFLSLYLGLELLSLPLYALCAYSKVHPSGGEAGIKYFMTGALASGLFLYGFSLIYGVTGTLFPSEAAGLISHLNAPHTRTAIFGLVFVVVGIAFKLGAVPFHMWLPDVYQGAPHSVALIIGTLPKLAALGLAIRIFEGFPASYHMHWEKLLLILAVLSIGVGNLMALVQTNFKRLLGFSAISHIGFLLLGLLIAPMRGYGPTFYYLCIYLLMVLGTFASLMALSRDGFECEEILDLKGLYHSQPQYAWGLLIVMFSMGGIPPLAGFYAKFMILDGLMKSNYQFLTIYSLVCSVIGAFYYLYVIRVMFFESPPESALPAQDMGLAFKATLTLNQVAILGLGLAPQLVLPFCLFNLH